MGKCAGRKASSTAFFKRLRSAARQNIWREYDPGRLHVLTALFLLESLSLCVFVLITDDILFPLREDGIVRMLTDLLSTFTDRWEALALFEQIRHRDPHQVAWP